MKRCVLILLCGIVCIQLAGCSGWKVRTSTSHQPRVDQEIAGNRGFIFGQPTSAPKEPTFKDRKVYRVEVEIPEWKKKRKAAPEEAKPISRIKEPSIQPSKEDAVIWGNQGYITGGPEQKVTEEVPVTTDIIPQKPQLQKSPFAKIREKIITPKESMSDQAAKMRTYQVRKGDTLQKISRKFYGTTKKWTLLYQANRNKLKSPDCVYPGQVLVIPEVSEYKK